MKQSLFLLALLPLAACNSQSTEPKMLKEETPREQTERAVKESQAKAEADKARADREVERQRAAEKEAKEKTKESPTPTPTPKKED